MPLTKNNSVDLKPYIHYVGDDSQSGGAEAKTLEITENGTYPVIGYANAAVNVEGGGGGSDIGTLQLAPFFYSGTISENEEIDTSKIPAYYVAGFSIGDKYAVKAINEPFVLEVDPCIASGIDCILTFSETVPTILGVYDVTFDMESGVFLTVSEISVTTSSTTVDWYPDEVEPIPALQFTMPELANGHSLFFKVSAIQIN